MEAKDYLNFQIQSETESSTPDPEVNPVLEEMKMQTSFSENLTPEQVEGIRSACYGQLIWTILERQKEYFSRQSA